MNNLEDILIPLAFFALTFGIVYFAVTTRHRERMKMIENGIDPSLFYNKGNKKGMAIKAGGLLVGIGLGLFLGSLLGEALNNEIAIPGMILICGGSGLLIANHFANKNGGEENSENPG